MALENVSLSNNLSYIGISAFKGCKRLSEIVILDSVKEIGGNVFSDTGFTEFTIPSSVTYFNASALSGISTLKKIYVENGHSELVSKDGVLYTKGYKELVLYPGGRTSATYELDKNTIGFYASSVPFAGNEFLKKIVFSKNISIDGCISTLTVYGNGKNNKLSAMAKKFGCKYADVSNGCDTILGVTFEDTVQTIAKGKKANIGTVVYPEKVTHKKVVYMTSNPDIATVSNNGIITAVSGGQCYVTAMVTGADGCMEYARCKIIVSNGKLEDAAIKLSCTKYTYDGKAKKPGVTVKLNKVKLKKDVDYTVSYKNNKNIGTATVTITGKGNYTGTIIIIDEIQESAEIYNRIREFTRQFKCCFIVTGSCLGRIYDSEFRYSSTTNIN